MRSLAMAIVLVVAAASPALLAQSPTRTAEHTQEQIKARSNISIMEGVLERAVNIGADSLNRKVREVAPQDTLVPVTGAAEARGFRLEGYGVFFDVEVPVLRQSVAWSLRALMDQSGVPLSVALQQLRAYIRTITDMRTRQPLEQALQRIELQVGVLPQVPVPGRVGAAAVAAQSAPRELSPTVLAWLNDPNGAYTDEVKGALIDAMLDHSTALGIGAEEWLTVAARDNERRDRLNPGDDLGSIILRIKGSDLAALRAGRITAQDARKRVQVREY